MIKENCGKILVPESKFLPKVSNTCKISTSADMNVILSSRKIMNYNPKVLISHLAI